MRKGITRIVFCISGIAIKFPNPFNGHLNFLLGCLGNWKERKFCKEFKYLKEINLVSPSYWCSWFGLIQIQKRAAPREKPLSWKELEKFDSVRNGETKPQNFGYIDGKLVCIDYA